MIFAILGFVWAFCRLNMLLLFCADDDDDRSVAPLLLTPLAAYTGGLLFSWNSISTGAKCFWLPANLQNAACQTDVTASLQPWRQMCLPLDPAQRSGTTDDWTRSTFQKWSHISDFEKKEKEKQFLFLRDAIELCPGWDLIFWWSYCRIVSV